MFRRKRMVRVRSSQIFCGVQGSKCCDLLVVGLSCCSCLDWLAIVAIAAVVAAVAAAVVAVVVAVGVVVDDDVDGCVSVLVL